LILLFKYEILFVYLRSPKHQLDFRFFPKTLQSYKHMHMQKNYPS